MLLHSISRLYEIRPARIVFRILGMFAVLSSMLTFVWPATIISSKLFVRYLVVNRNTLLLRDTALHLNAQKA